MRRRNTLTTLLIIRKRHVQHATRPVSTSVEFLSRHSELTPRPRPWS
jgi:hypothetical protein